MKVVSPLKYELRGGLVIEKGETVIDSGRVSPISKAYLDKLIHEGSVSVVDEKPAKKMDLAKTESKAPEPKAETSPVEATTKRKTTDDK